MTLFAVLPPGATCAESGLVASPEYPNRHRSVTSHFVISVTKAAKDVTINYGIFINAIINFLIVAFVLFLFIKKFLGWLMRAKKEEAAAPAMTKDQELLVEIRDLLKQQPAGK